MTIPNTSNERSGRIPNYHESLSSFLVVTTSNLITSYFNCPHPNSLPRSRLQPVVQKWLPVYHQPFDGGASVISFYALLRLFWYVNVRRPWPCCRCQHSPVEQPLRNHNYKQRIMNEKLNEVLRTLNYTYIIAPFLFTIFVGMCSLCEVLDTLQSLL